MEISLGKTNHRQVCSMLKLIYQNPGINRKALVESLCIDRAMVTHIYNYLVSQGWLLEQESTQKRLPLLLNENRIYAAGVEIQPESQNLSVCNLSGKEVFQKSFEEPVTDIPSFLNDFIYPVLEKLDLEVAGIGLALPGICNKEDNKILKSFPFNISDPVTFPTEVTVKGKNIPLFVDNDVRCWGWGKIAFQKEKNSFFVFSQHFIDDKEDESRFSRITGGGAFFMDGKPVTGANGCAGEMPCVFRFDDFRNFFIPLEDRYNMKSKKETREEYLKSIGLTVSFISTILDFKKVFISGFENMPKPLLRTLIDRGFSQYRFYPELQNVEVVFEDDYQYTTAKGACGLVLEELIVRPCEKEELVSRLVERH